MSFLSSFVSVLYFTLVDINTYSTWLEIDLNALKNNVAEVIRMTGREVMAVIKANGYGHGMRPIAQACVAGEQPGAVLPASKKPWLCAGQASRTAFWCWDLRLHPKFRMP